jgi:hypothetical protein
MNLLSAYVSAASAAAAVAWSCFASSGSSFAAIVVEY